MSVFSEESLHLRRELAYACRILAANGQNDAVYGHVTYRETGAQTFWMKPSTLGLDEITPETLIRVDLEGNIVEGELPRHLEFPILAASSGHSFRWTNDAEIAGKREKIFGVGMVRNVWNYYCRRIGPL
jgi:hypothetical protein